MSGALEVLHCDNHVLAVRKPAGLACVPDASGDESLLDRARAWIEREFAKPGRAWLGVVHRLDRPVSGVVVFARTSKAAARLAEQWRDRSTQKTYWGVGAGAPSASSGALTEWLVKDETRNLVRPVPAGRPGSLEARTEWCVLESARDRTLYELRPLTGRPHQLRSCLRALSTPLLGDLKYGAREPLPDASIALHALEVAFRHPTRDERLTLRAAPPATPAWDFECVRRRTRGASGRTEGED
jgi:23S rRNA pseudouridine1911/1915/1917 synthase